MDQGSYKISELEKKYEKFLAPSIEITLDGKKLDTSKTPITELEVELSAGGSAGGCTFTVDSLFDYEKSEWKNEIAKSVKVGTKLEVSGGYVKRSPLFYGYVDESVMEHSNAGAPKLKIFGIDGLGFLMSCNEPIYGGKTKSKEIITNILKKSVAAGFAKKFTVDSGNALKEFTTPLVKERMDDFRFLQLLAQRYGMNEHFFPLERNRYFYGKLLTVRDFEVEQQYNRAKRELLNRVLQGAGVVCGFGVTASDDATLMIESGLAMDYQGREIVLPETIFRKLQMLDGQETLAGGQQAYLCLTYDEAAVEPVNAVGGEAGESSQFNMAGYTALVEAGSALVELLRDNLTPEPIGNREMIALCSPHSSENNQLTAYLYQVEEDTQGASVGYYQAEENLQRISPSRYSLRFLLTAHSKAPAQLREADQYRIVGAALQVLKDHPVIDRQYLSGSLAESGSTIHILLEKTTQDQMLKIWNNTSSPYKLSFVVMLTGVEIESRRTRRVGRVTDVVITTQTKQRGEPE